MTTNGIHFSGVCTSGTGHTELCPVCSYLEGASLGDGRSGNDETLYDDLGPDNDAFDTQVRWYPMRIWHASAKKAFDVRKALHDIGITTYLRLEYSEQIKNQELQEIARPVFSNLIFVRVKKKIMRRLKNTSPSLKSLQFMTKVKHGGNTPTEIIHVRDKDMENFIAAETRDDPYHQRQHWVCDDSLAKPGRKVRILRGPFAGITGEIKNFKTHRVVVVKLTDLGLANAITRIPRKDLAFYSDTPADTIA